MMTQTTGTKLRNPLTYRHETKHRINQLDDYDLSTRVRKLFKRDTNAGSHGSYRVSSLYFDSPTDKALREKVDGVNRREKFRIRYYEDNLDFIRLEKKTKHNSLGLKHSAKLTKEQVLKILDGDLEFLLHSQNALLVEFYSKCQSLQLKPKTIVVYDREAFIYEPGNCRITFDRNLRTSINPSQFLNPNKIFYDISDSFTVLEVKYDHYCPDLVKNIVQINRQASAISKYSVSRHYE